MTTIEPDHLLGRPADRPSPVLWRILRLAVPLMVGTLVAAGLQVLKTAILTHHGDTAALFTLAQVQPAFIFMLACLESLAIANQVFSSKSVTNWPKGDVLRATRAFTVIGLVLTAVLAGGFFAAGPLLAGWWPGGTVLLPQMALFVASMAPFLLFELRNGALRGQGRTGQALAAFGVLIVADAVVTWVAVTQYDLGFNAVLVGNAAGPLVALPVVVWMLRREIGTAVRGPVAAFRKHMIGMVIGVAGPVFASMFAGSASAAVIFPAMAALGADVSSAFLIVVRIRIFFIIPAVAMGSAIAILINQLPERGFAAEKRAVLLSGVAMVLVLYALATVGAYAGRFWLVAQIVPVDNAGLSVATIALIDRLIATFYLIAVFTMLQVILEHLGLGVRVLLVTVVSEVATIVLCLQALPQGLPGLVWVMNGVAVATFAVLAVVFVMAGRGLGRAVGDRDAV